MFVSQWRGEGSVKLLLQRASEKRKNLKEGVRQTLLLMQYDLSDDDTRICLASIRAGTYGTLLHMHSQDLSVYVCDLCDVVANDGGRMIGVFYLRRSYGSKEKER